MAKEYTYISKWFTYSGKRYVARGKTLEEAIMRKAEMLQKLKAGEITSGGGMPLSVWTETVLDTYRPNASEETIEQSRLRLHKHLLDDLGRYAVEKITPLQLQAVLNRQKSMSASHIRKLSQEIYFIFDCARKNGMITKNPAEDLIRPRGTTKPRRALTATEREHFLKVLPSDDRFVFFALMLWCGCRPGEAARVMYEDVVAKQGVYFLHIRGTKTVNSDRLVPIPKELQPYLVKTSLTGFCALTQAGTPHTKSSYKRMVSSLKRAMNISMGAKVYRNELIPPLPLADDFVPYLFRHTYCTDLKKAGIDVMIAKDLMGHADIKTTANIYAHSDDDTLMLAARLINSPDV